MDSKSLARAVACDLGPEVLAAVERSELPGEASRGLSEIMAVGSFIAASAQVALQLWQVRKDRALLALALAAGLEAEEDPEVAADPRLSAAKLTPEQRKCLASSLDPEKRLGIIARLINRLIPEAFTSAPSFPLVTRPGKTDPRSKQEWLVDWTSFDSKTRELARAMTQPILLPFADMDYWIVYKPIYWTPPANAPKSLPRAITVPAGFVSDFASVPSYFWWALPPTGRYGHAAILHDWLYWEQSCSRAVADRVFEVAMAELNVDLPLRKGMWAAVRVGGGKLWDDVPAEKRRGGSRVLKRMPETPVTFAEWKSNPDVFA
jgi:Protein of unknown function (DUF1353)